MQSHLHHITLLIKRLGILLLLFSLCRVLFYLFNASYFTGVTSTEFIIIFLHGIRFDVSAIVIYNVLFIIMHLIPLSQRENPLYQKMLKILFHSFNSIALLANCIDIEYFKFTFKRSTADIFNLIGISEDVINLVPQIFMDYWHLAVIFGLLLWLAEFLYGKKSQVPNSKPLGLLLEGLMPWALFVFCIGIFVIGARGGLQLKPIGIITAGQYTPARNIPLVLNTPFAIINTLGKQELKEVEYFTGEQLTGIYSPLHNETGKTDMYIPGYETSNVVIIILESFSNEYIGAFNGTAKSYTPFLDSLAGEGLVFTHCFANGKKSIEAVPAILAGIPTLMNNPYITSIYAGNDINSIAGLLSEKGYHTSFYHGGINGTMGFDAFAKTAGFEHYYGKNEYGNDSDYDGTWGIFDEEFFQFFAANLNETRQPFFTCVFSLSSHLPYTIPEKYESMFREGELKIHRSIRYTDFALRKFFNSASEMKWFDNTLFVITADHTSDAVSPFYQNMAGMYAIPLIFYKRNSNLKGVSRKTTQQTDIMPSVLSYLGYKEQFIAFGKNVFDTAYGNGSATLTTKRTGAVNFLNDVYQLIEDDYMLQFDGNKSIGLYNFKTDSLLQNNLLTSELKIEEQMKRKLKAFIQVYNHRLINNKLKAK